MHGARRACVARRCIFLFGLPPRVGLSGQVGGDAGQAGWTGGADQRRSHPSSPPAATAKTSIQWPSRATRQHLGWPPRWCDPVGNCMTLGHKCWLRWWPRQPQARCDLYFRCTVRPGADCGLFDWSNVNRDQAAFAVAAPRGPLTVLSRCRPTFVVPSPHASAAVALWPGPRPPTPRLDAVLARLPTPVAGALSLLCDSRALRVPARLVLSTRVHGEAARPSRAGARSPSSVSFLPLPGVPIYSTPLFFPAPLPRASCVSPQPPCKEDSPRSCS